MQSVLQQPNRAASDAPLGHQASVPLHHLGQATSSNNAGSPVTPGFQNSSDHLPISHGQCELRTYINSLSSGTNQQTDAENSSSFMLQSDGEDQAGVGIQGHNGALVRAEPMIHDKLWTQEEGMVEYPQQYWQQVGVQPKYLYLVLIQIKSDLLTGLVTSPALP